MTNYSIPKVELKTINSFGQVSSKKPSDYWLPAQTLTGSIDSYDKKDNNTSQSEEALLKTLVLTPSEARKTNNVKTIGLSIAGVTVLTTATLFFLLKGGGSTGLSKNFQKIKDFLERKINSARLDTDNIKSFTNGAYIFAYKSVDVIMKRIEAINNFTAFKDVAFKRMMCVWKPLEKVHNGITKMFERIGRQSVIDSYEKTGKTLENAFKRIHPIIDMAKKHNPTEIVEINSKKLTRAEWFEYAESLNGVLQEQFNKAFVGESLIGRYHKIKKSVEAVKVAFDKLSKFWSKDVYKDFMAEAMLVDPRRAIRAEVIDARRVASFSLKNLRKDSDASVMRISGLLSLNDSEQIYKLRQIRVEINDFTKTSKQDRKSRADIIKHINQLEASIKAEPSRFGTEQNYHNLMTEINDLKILIQNYEPGLIQEILKVYKYILPKKDYQAIASSYNEYVSSLDKSIRLETEDFVSKLRDLVLGSAPTDILSILGGLGVLGYHLGKSDNNEQRTSISLKYGIPSIAGIGVTMYCNAKLFAGTKSLVIGTISTLLLNKIGSWADDNLLKFKKDKNNNHKSQANKFPEVTT